MTFQELLNSPVFFNTFLKNDTFFTSIKDKFPEILADLTSARNNPNCSCKNRVKAHLQAKITTEEDYFNNLINNEEIKKLLQEKAEEIKASQVPSNPMENHFQMIQQNIFKNNGGRVFEIGKSEEDWKSLCKKLELEKISFKSFSVVEKEDKLVVYFI
jgi:arsenate reductase-like glutaredoxin family protein